MNIVIEQKSITINLLGRDFQVACPEGKEDALERASEFLNQHMEQINANTKLLRMDKIVIQTALNLSNELLVQQTEHERAYADLCGKLSILQTKLDTALSKTNIVDLDS